MEATKAFRINLDKIEGGYLYSDMICHAKNKSEAKSRLLKEYRYDSLRLKYSNEDVTFLTIPVERYPEYDLQEFEGEFMTSGRVQEIKQERDRRAKLDEMLADNSIQYCYIYKNGGYYRPGSCGYTDYKTQAGVYKKQEAIAEARSVREIQAIPINIELHNRDINTQIDSLRSRLLPTK